MPRQVVSDEHEFSVRTPRVTVHGYQEMKDGNWSDWRITVNPRLDAYSYSFHVTDIDAAHTVAMELTDEGA